MVVIYLQMEATGVLAFALWNKHYIKCVCVQCKFFCSEFIVEHLERKGNAFWLTVDAVMSVEFVSMLCGLLIALLWLLACWLLQRKACF